MLELRFVRRVVPYSWAVMLKTLLTPRVHVLRLVLLLRCVRLENIRSWKLQLLQAAIALSPPCGGCRQKLSEFATGDIAVTMVTAGGAQETMGVADLLPGAFDLEHLNAGATTLDN